ncbi:MAG: hypothetical protein QM767_16705 [Anaeromyxobacter sp.]
MTGAAIIRREAQGTTVLAVHGAFDGCAAWALRLEMDACGPGDFVVDLTQADEACEFAACLLASYAQGCRRERRIRFVPGAPDQARLLAAFNLECVREPPPLHAAAAARNEPAGPRHAPASPRRTGVA